MGMNTPQKVFTGIFILIVIFWVALFATHTTEGVYNYTYSFVFGLIPLLGGFYSMYRSHIWGGMKSAVGRAVSFIGLGVFCWGMGETIWSYYNFFLNIAAPYPSLADLFFAPSIFFYGLGMVFLSQATGAKYALRNGLAKIFAIGAPLVIAAISYYLLVVVARGGVLIPEGETTLKAILDVVYPFGDFLGLTLGIVISGLSFKYLGGKYRLDTYAILAGLGVMFVADTVFSYTTTVGSYYNADFGDLLLTVGTFLLTYGVLGFSRVKSLKT
jgi:hypothetical protein